MNTSKRILINTFLLVPLLVLTPTNSAFAYDCLLDTNNDGNADTNVDTTASANSGGGGVSIACGGGARTSSTGTALGTDAFADALNSIAIGRDGNVSAAAENGIAIGRLAIADAPNTIAMGAGSLSTSPGSLSFGVDARARGTGAIALGVGADVGSGIGPSLISAPGGISIGIDSNASGINAIAIGRDASAPQTSPIGGGNIAIGRFAKASGVDAIALGVESFGQGDDSLSLGFKSDAVTDDSIAIGAYSVAGSGSLRLANPGGIAIGGDLNGDSRASQALASHAIALGSESQVVDIAEGGIAIGGDVDGDGVGALSTAVNAIAIGADVVADVADTAFFGTAIRVTRDDNANISIENTNALSASRNLLNLTNSGSTGLIINNTDAGASWRLVNVGNNFRISRQGTGSAELRLNSNGTLRLTGNSMAVNHINTSSRKVKTGFSAINNQDILEKVAQLPISTWVYKTQLDDQHIGPMAEDFQDIFEIGDGSHISTVDTAGITLAAIQRLKQLSDEKDAEIEVLTHFNEELRLENANFNSKLVELMSKLDTLIKLNPQLAINQSL